VEYFFILASFVCTIAVYLWISISDRSFFNVLTPWFVFLVPATYLLELYHLYTFGPSASAFAYGYMYACYAAAFLAFAMGYACFRTRALHLPFSSAGKSGNVLAPYLALAGAILAYLPVLIEFRGSLANPRQIYEQTRTGYGVYSYTSVALCLMAFILLLFKRRLGAIELSSFTSVCLVFLWVHGNKGPMLTVIFILLMYLVYQKQYKFPVGRFVLLGGALAIFGLGLFLLTNPGLLFDKAGFEGLAGYSDYTRNGMMVIDSDIAPLYGRLTLEQEVFSRIPRPIFPGKPNDFGSFYLAKHFFPSAFAQNAGDPAFSFGTLLADFGPLTLPIIFVFYLLGGIFLRVFMTGLRQFNDPGNFMLVLYCCGLSVIPLSGSIFLLETIILAIFVNLLSSARVFAPRTTPEPSAKPT
jgi:hypothetical protein